MIPAQPCVGKETSGRTLTGSNAGGAKKRWMEAARSDGAMVSSRHQGGQKTPIITLQSVTENMKVWINSLQLTIEKMKDEEKWHNNYISILSRKKIKGEEKGI